MSSHSNSPDCTEKCKSTQHGDLITSAISKRGVSDSDLCSYLNYVCTCCESVKDSVGRTALHVAASCGRVNLIKWLVNNRHANINAKDDESGYTPLHRSIFYGKIDAAVELVRLGANVGALDAESLSCLEHAMKDGFKPDFSEESMVGTVYVWGTNANNSLGVQARGVPEAMDGFHRENAEEEVKQMCVDQFHSVIVTKSGKAFSCGHGQGGRLGLGTEQTVVNPTQIVFPENPPGEPVSCLYASISRDHSIFLCCNGHVYTCGQNDNKVLGLSPPPQELLVPKSLKNFSIDLEGVCASRYHSVAWGPTGLYTWGVNGGQLGHNQNSGKYVITPKLVTCLNLSATMVLTVESSDGATAVCSNRGDIYVLHEYQCRKIASRQLNIIQISIIGGKLNLPDSKELSNKHSRELKVAALTNTGNLLLWQETDPQLCRCIFSINRALILKHVAINLNEILFVTNDGEAFSGVTRPRKKKSGPSEKDNKTEKNAFHKFLEREDCIYVKLTKFGKMNRALRIQSDPKGRDYSVIQAYPYRFFAFAPYSSSGIEDDFRQFFEEINEYDIHDVTFKIGHEIYPAHGFIVSSKSPHLAKLIEDQNGHITLENINPDIFWQFLTYIYTGRCELIQIGELKSEKLRKLCIKPKKSSDEDNLNEIEIDTSISAFEFYKNNKKTLNIDENIENTDNFKDPVKLLRELSKKMGVTDLFDILTNLCMSKFEVKNKTSKVCYPKPVRYSRDKFQHLYDVSIKCKDGKILRAHKCVLVARLEYFKFMFSMRWQGGETSEISLPFSKTVVESLLEYIYTDSLSNLDTSKDIDHLLKVLMLADHLMVTPLKEQCEHLLTNMLTLKNAVQLLSFSHDLNNAQKLNECCAKFVVWNMTWFLETNALSDLDADVLKRLSDVYFNEKKELQCRVLTPYSTAVSDEEVMSVVQNFPVDLNIEVDVKEKGKTAQKRRSRTHKTSTEKQSISLEIPKNETTLQFLDSTPTIPKTSEALIPNRLKSITSACEKLKDEPIESNFTKLSSSLDLSSSLGNECQFPELGSPPNNNFYKTPTKEASKHKMVKISQKQRKRLNSTSGSAEKSPVAESPKNPWKILPDVTDFSQNVARVSDIGSIVSDEKRQKENLVKLTTKSLRHTQTEDKAIEDLHKFYNTENMTDEVILIERVGMGAIASPTWVPRVK